MESRPVGRELSDAGPPAIVLAMTYTKRCIVHAHDGKADESGEEAVGVYPRFIPPPLDLLGLGV
jgi:hypothetical protein